jgi:hypothetical protein
VAGFEIVILPASALRAYKPIREALCEHVVAAIFLKRRPPQNAGLKGNGNKLRRNKNDQKHSFDITGHAGER